MMSISTFSFYSRRTLVFEKLLSNEFCFSIIFHGKHSSHTLTIYENIARPQNSKYFFKSRATGVNEWKHPMSYRLGQPGTALTLQDN